MANRCPGDETARERPEDVHSPSPEGSGATGCARAMTGHARAREAVFLGDADLGMETIRQLLQDLVAIGSIALHDRRLFWGAKASAYRKEIDEAVAFGQPVVFVELADDLPPRHPGRERMTWVDHHGAASTLPTSLEQIFDRYRKPLAARGRGWTRDDCLVAANDRGHAPAMAAAGATQDEMFAVRVCW
jgi:hypothetical protein